MSTMKNPPKTPHHSIFEPLFSLDIAPPPSAPLIPLPAPPSQLCLPCGTLADPGTDGSPLSTMKRALAASTSLNADHPPTNSIKPEMDPSSAAPKKAKSELDLLMPASANLDHGKLPSLSSSSVGHGCMVTRSAPRKDIDADDGSVASRLLASISKSISSPSLLSCCKEPSRETSYQKSQKLKTMKLQYCAEELGSESWDVSSTCGDGTFDTFNQGRSASILTEVKFSERHENTEGSLMTSVMSAPNLRCPSLHRSSSSAHIVTKTRSFPPPLTRSSSFSYSLRPYRQDGRFVLKEVKVPCRQYFQASRLDGRLTLQLLPTSEEDTTLVEDNLSGESTAEEHASIVDDSVMEDKSAGNVVTADIELRDMGDGVIVSANPRSQQAVGVAKALDRKEKKEVDDVGSGEELVYCVAACKMEKVVLVAGHDTIEDVVGKKLVDGGVNGDFHINVMSNTAMTKKMWSDARLSHEPGGPMDHGAHLVQWKGNVLPRSTSPVLRGLLGGASRGTADQVRWQQYSGVGKGPQVGPSSTVVFKDASLIQKISGMVASLGLASAAYAAAWDGHFKKMSMKASARQGNIGMIKERRRDGGGGNNGMMEGDGGSSTDSKELVNRCGINGVLNASTRHNITDEGGNKTLQLDFDVHIPASSTIHLTALFNTNSWPHPPHCKELFHRSHDQVAAMPGFMKLHYVAIRS